MRQAVHLCRDHRFFKGFERAGNVTAGQQHVANGDLIDDAPLGRDGGRHSAGCQQPSNPDLVEREWVEEQVC
jgi:hypothetical protein